MADNKSLMAADLRDSVRDYHAAETTESEREAIREWWTSQDVRNQMHALMRAHELEPTSHA